MYGSDDIACTHNSLRDCKSHGTSGILGFIIFLYYQIGLISATFLDQEAGVFPSIQCLF